MASEAARTRKGFRVACPHCCEYGTITLNVEDVHTLTCTSCEAELDADEVRAIIDGWARLLEWLDTAPEMDG